MSTAPPAAGSVREALEAATDALRAAGVDTPRLDAEVLFADALGSDRAALLAHGDEGIAPEAARRIGVMVRRRVRREPVAYITGSKWFRHIELAVDPRVLIPRPETELLVEVALDLRPSTVLDVGTGSGAVALAIADELPGAVVTGIDTSAGAIEVARGNAKRLGYEGRVTFHQADVSTFFDMPGINRHDLVVANLPYVAEADWAGLQPEIRDYEPREALIAGADGLAAIRSLLDSSPQCQSLALEVGIGQAEEVERLVQAAGFPDTTSRADLAGIERVVVGQR